ncbi:MAG: 50S ribosomal protein L28 [Candidatus Zixiibacteriota bacterium]
MSQVCYICGKKPQVGNTRSHANNAMKRRFKPNLQKVRALVDGKQKKILACTSCIKAGKITKVVS